MGVQFRDYADVGQAVIWIGNLFSDHRQAHPVRGSWAVVDPGAEYRDALCRHENFSFRKTDAFYRLVEQASYPPFLDVFARKRRPRWTVWGNGIAEAA